MADHSCPLCEESKRESIIVHQAIGMVMARFDLDAHDALVKLDSLAAERSMARLEAATALVSNRFEDA